MARSFNTSRNNQNAWSEDRKRDRSTAGKKTKTDRKQEHRIIERQLYGTESKGTEQY